MRLRHRTLWAIVEGYYAHQARKTLSLVEAIALGNGNYDEKDRKEVIQSLMKRSGFAPPVKRVAAGESWMAGLADMFRGAPGVAHAQSP